MIEIRDLYKYYGESRALGPVSIKIDQGEIIGLLGLNGAGKTTALRILACDLLPSSGTVLVDGLDVVEQPEAVRERIGYLPDTPPLYNEMRVAEFLGFAARLRGVAGADVEKSVLEVMRTTGLTEVAGKSIGALSHGFRQRVGIAQAVVHSPKLVILDEPISGLDPVQIVEMRALVRALGGKHTVIVSSHILSEISETCDRIFVIKSGEIVASGTEAELSTQLLEGVRLRVTIALPGLTAEEALTRMRRAFTTVEGVTRVEPIAAAEPGDGVVSVSVEASTDVRPALCRAAVAADLGLLELSRHERELESVFLRLAAPAPSAAQAAPAPMEAQA